ncbi:MAG: response regulator [Planctomycetes bacterium]|uniref:ATP-binding protein n=1 Tax=Candidatus Wunengus sp. YC65 TaxID=3367701 RepID=UPI001D30190E|nr:response regulator [Planctomycetota bacterium]
MKFATKLTFIVTGIVLVVGFAASYFVYIANANVLKNQIISRYKEQSINTIDKLDRMLFARVADIKVLAKSPVFTHKCFTGKDITKQFIEFRNSYKTYLSLSFFDMNRISLADTYGLDIGKQQRLSPCWEEILKDKDFAMCIYVDETLQVPIICFMHVVKNPEGRKIGVINAKMPINKLNDILGELNPDAHNQHIQFDLVNSDGLLVYSNYNRKGVLKDKLADLEVVNNYLAGKEYCFVSQYAGEKSFYVVTPECGFLDFKGNNWVLIVRIPLKIALKPAVELRNKMTVIASTFGIFLIPILMVFARLMTKPIVSLRDAALEIGKGNFGVKLETTSKDEVGQLYACFNTMTAGLKESQDRLMNYSKELEARVSERTGEIYLLQSLAIVVSASGNLHDALVVAMQKICNYTGWIYGEAWVPNQDGTRLERDNAFYSSIEGLEKFSGYSCGLTFTPGSGLPGRSWAEKQPVWIKDVTQDPHYLRATIASEVGLKTGIGFPVIADGEVVSVFVFYSLKAEERNDHLAKLILSMLSQIGSIIRRIQAEDARKKLWEQLYRSQNLASIGKLAGGVAHNFNNLLTVIMGYASLLNKELEEKNKLKDYVQKILKSSETAASLTQDLLAFSRKQPISAKPVNVNEIIKQSESLLSRLIREDIALKTILTREDTTVMADVGQIEQVLMNLATNARDAMPNGGNLAIHTDIMEMDDAFIRSYGYGSAGIYVHILVTDTGVGMDENTRMRVFEPFFTTKEVGKGTGLGLASVYGIVKQHGGYINAESEPAKGATFNIYLPLIKLEAEKGRGESHTVLSRGGTETVLLAEDEPEVRELIKMVFEHAGYTVIEAVDGEDALNKFSENKDDIDILVLDVIMPRKNGKEVYEAIKKMKPRMKVLFMSGYSDDIIRKRDFLDKGLDCILKPSSPDDLLEKVRKILDKPGT